LPLGAVSEHEIGDDCLIAFGKTFRLLQGDVFDGLEHFLQVVAEFFLALLARYFLQPLPQVAGEAIEVSVNIASPASVNHLPDD
jgi:hypothetical protein